MPGDTVVIRLPGPRALRVLARSVLFAVALLFLPWLRAAEAPARRHTADTCGAAAAQAELLLRDLRREGLLAPGARAVVLGSDGNCDAPPKQDQDGVLRPASLRRMLMLGDSSVDFLLDFGYFDEDGDRFAFADRVLKHGGILAVPIDTLSAFSLPQNYCVIYTRRFAEAFVAVKKIAPAGDNGDAGARMDDSSLASLKEGVVSSEPPETASPELKNMGRKLLLSDRRGSLQMPHQDHSQS
ncbi:hypothetical protein SEVIR_1G335000v4 [Setaria viridis]|uniref:Uncharacterized protein n=1 Tax=Setaria viridis TaxID=4556 RepID=A0A4V6Y939_SETVI|nr:uncharacterized protein LOC117839033 [Setaria viridis]TKW41706.1 hypothetical protein SEVIR_1G335000v2 [Setaria viridis]